MKFRAFVLVACMVVVPLTAMFSHRLPPSFRGWPHRLLARLSGGDGEPGPSAAPIDAVAEAPLTDPVAAPPATAFERTALERLTAEGAVAIECRPLPGGIGQVASCRVPVDADGQLQRVFQARGADAEAALTALDVAVANWRRLTAADDPLTRRR